MERVMDYVVGTKILLLLVKKRFHKSKASLPKTVSDSSLSLSISEKEPMNKKMNIHLLQISEAVASHPRVAAPPSEINTTEKETDS
jgi:hypothetical protein